MNLSDQLEQQHEIKARRKIVSHLRDYSKCFDTNGFNSQIQSCQDQFKEHTCKNGIPLHLAKNNDIPHPDSNNSILKTTVLNKVIALYVYILYRAAHHTCVMNLHILLMAKFLTTPIVTLLSPLRAKAQQGKIIYYHVLHFKCMSIDFFAILIAFPRNMIQKA